MSVIMNSDDKPFSDKEITTFYVVIISILSIGAIFSLLLLCIYYINKKRKNLKYYLNIQISLITIICFILKIIYGYLIIAYPSDPITITKIIINGLFFLLSLQFLATIAFILFYSYLFLEHTEFIEQNSKIIIIIFHVITWSYVIIINIVYVILDDKSSNKLGEPVNSSTGIIIADNLYIYILLFFQFFSFYKIIRYYKTIKEEIEDEGEKEQKKQIMNLGFSLILIVVSLLLSFSSSLFSNNLFWVYFFRTLSSLNSVIYLFFYGYDKEDIDTLKRWILCKNEEKNENNKEIDLLTSNINQ